MDSNSLEIIRRHEGFLTSIQESIRNTERSDRIDVDRVMKSIRQLKGEIEHGKPEDIPHLFHQLEQQHTLLKRFAGPEVLPDSLCPYFGHMRLQEGEEIRDILLGHLSFLPRKSDLKVVNWSEAPISQVYFAYKQGEEFELELPDKTIEGILLEKSVLTIIRGELVRIDLAGTTQSFVKKNKEWINLEQEVIRLQGGAQSACREINLGTGQTGLVAPDVLSLLDQTQYRLLRQPRDRSLLIIGSAGSGKTTVALHRIAHLSLTERIHPNHIIVIVPRKGLARLSKKLLSQINLEKVKVTTNRDWIKNQALRIFDDLPPKECHVTPPDVSTLKQSPHFITLVDLYIKEEGKRVEKKLLKENLHELAAQFRKYPTIPIIARLGKLLQDNPKLDPIKKIIIQNEVAACYDFERDRQAIFRDRNFLLKLVELSDNSITKRMVEITHRHSLMQFEGRDLEGEYRDLTLDGKTVDEGTPMEVSGTIDYEDYPFLFYLQWKKTGEWGSYIGNLSQYTHIVLDEAQELAPLETLIFKGALRRRGSFTVAGDSLQHIDRSSHFESWEKLLTSLNLDDVETHELKISYRSTKSIVDFSSILLGPLLPTNPITTIKEGAPVEITLAQHRAHAALLMNEALEELIREEPKASIAIICHRGEMANKFYEELKHLGKVRLILDGEFTFNPGLDITTVDQVKGLEFDYVILPDVDPINYGTSSFDRRRLYLAATRAIHQLWVISQGKKHSFLQ